MVDQQHAQAALPRDGGAMQPGRAGADDERVEAGAGVYGRHTNGKASCFRNPFGT